jgi:FKBP-type peptidyl-prolyl cis-trans isomerase FkpA
MKTISSYVWVSLVLLGAISCTNSDFKKTKSGLLYKIYSDGKGPVAKKGEFLKGQVSEKLRDSVLFATYGGVPLYVRVDSTGPTYSPAEIFPMLRKGDSAVVVMLADTIQRKSGGQLPPFMKKKDKIIVTFKITDIFASQDLLMADRTQELQKEKDREVRDVENYLAKNNIQAQKSTLGAYYVVETPGDGPKVDSGKQVSVRYTGKLFPSGKVFQSNMTGPGNAPFKFVVGAHQIIPGWDDALRNFRQGGKGTLYIPAFLAYNDQKGPGGKQFEDLIFDIVVDTVRDAPPTPAQPMGPMQRMPMRPGQMPMRPGQPMMRPGGQPQPQQPQPSH